MISIALARQADPLFRELAQMLADGFRNVGRSSSVFDASEAPTAAEAVVLFGDCLGMGEVLERAGGAPILLWQLEPLPPAEVVRMWATTDRDATADRLLYRIEAIGTQLKRMIPPAYRNTIRLAARRLLLGQRVHADPDNESSKAYWGWHRVERIRMLEAAASTGAIATAFAGTPERTRALQQTGLEGRFLPIGYHPAMTPSRPIEKDIDVIFLGRIKGPRSKSLRYLTDELARREIELVVNEGPIFGTERQHLLARSRVSLQVRDIDEEMPRIRVVLSIAAGAVVVAEEAGDPRPLVPGKHFLNGPVDRIPDLIESVVRDEVTGAEMRSRAVDLFRSEMTMDHAASTMLAALDLTRQAS